MPADRHRQRWCARALVRAPDGSRRAGAQGSRRLPAARLHLGGDVACGRCALPTLQGPRDERGARAAPPCPEERGMKKKKKKKRRRNTPQEESVRRTAGDMSRISRRRPERYAPGAGDRPERGVSRCRPIRHGAHEAPCAQRAAPWKWCCPADERRAPHVSLRSAHPDSMKSSYLCRFALVPCRDIIAVVFAHGAARRSRVEGRARR